jgi:hypothetical protein
MVALRASRLVCEAITCQIDHDADAADVVGKTLHGDVGCACFFDGLAGDLRRGDHLAADFGDRGGQFLGARRHRLPLAEVSSAAEATAFTSALDWSAVADMPCAVACMELVDFCRPSSAVRTVASNSAIRASMREARSALPMRSLS